jgi:glycosyltransferase involved in cell wall biosynthesis
MPSVSVIIPTHRRPNLLPRAVASAQAAGRNVEVVVVDDASTDETAEVCQSLTGITYIRLDHNRGVAGARNAGLVKSRGEYITLLDDDDTRLPDSLVAQIEALEREPHAGLIYGRALLGDQEGTPGKGSYPSELPEGDIFWELLTRNFIPCGSVVFRRSCLTRVGLLDERIPGLDDWDLWVRMAEALPVLSSPEPIVVWRRSTPGSGQGTSNAAALVSMSVRQFHDVWMNLPRSMEAEPKITKAVWREFSENMAEHLIWESARALRWGLLHRPLQNLSIISRLYPLSLLQIVRHRILRRPRAELSASASSFEM